MGSSISQIIHITKRLMDKLKGLCKNKNLLFFLFLPGCLKLQSSMPLPLCGLSPAKLSMSHKIRICIDIRQLPN